LQKVLAAIFSNILGSLVWAAENAPNFLVCLINAGIRSGSFSKSTAIVTITGYLASLIRKINLWFGHRVFLLL
jgi:hypothetical protein